MIPLQSLAKTTNPGGDPVELAQRGQDWFLSVNRVPIRTTEAARVEEIAVIEACEPLAGKRQPRVLIEGLGLGVAARKALQVLPPRGRVTVAEVLPAVVEWQRRFLEPIVAPQPDHFRIRSRSLLESLEEQPAHYDAVLLELDYALDPFLKSGTRPAHYRAPLGILKTALRPLGRLVIHSVTKDPALMKALQLERFHVDHRLEGPHKRSKGRKQSLTIATLPAEDSH